jgi:hypothetical protein
MISLSVDHAHASEHYGERWGRHWLDAARYSGNFSWSRSEDADRYRRGMHTFFQTHRAVSRI